MNIQTVMTAPASSGGAALRPGRAAARSGPGRAGWQTTGMPAELDDLVALMPFAGEIGLTLDEASADRVVGRLSWAPRLCTSGGVLHGGVLMSAADSIGALVAFLGLAGGQTTATITSTTQM